jgi:Flp pilus assembly pilin Flp
MRYLARIFRNQDGATVIEYSLIIAILGLSSLTVLEPVCGSLTASMDYIISIIMQ